MLKHQKIFLVVVLSVVCASFVSSLNNGFINWDDKVHLLENPSVLSFDVQTLRRNFTSTVNNTYIPLSTLSFSFEYAFFKDNPFVYHLNNLILHLLNVFLVYVLGRQLGFSFFASSIAALLFGIHPMHVESVVWVTERKDVLYAFFYLLSMISYCRFIHREEKCFFYWSLFCGFLSVLAKPMALSLPLILWLIDWFLEGKINKKNIINKTPYFVFIIPIAAITYALNSRIPVGGVFEMMMTWIWTLSFYVQKFFIPVNLSALYALPSPVSIMQSSYYGAFLFVILNSVILICFRTIRVVRFAYLFYFVSIFFLLRFDHAVDQTVVANRFMYLPSLGFCFLFGFLVDRFFIYFKAKKIIVVLGGVCFLAVIVQMSLMTQHQGSLWNNSIRLWNDVIEKNDTIGFAYDHRAIAYLDDKKYLNVLEDGQRALELNSNDSLAYYLCGAAFLKLGDLDQALQSFDQSIKIDSRFEYVYRARGFLFQTQGNLKQALDDYTKAVEAKPFYYLNYFTRGVVYGLLGNNRKALADFDKTLNLNPQFARGYVNRGVLFGLQKKGDEAILNFNKALSLESSLTEAYYNRAQTYKFQKKYILALKDVQEAQRLGQSGLEGLIWELEQLLIKFSNNN